VPGHWIEVQIEAAAEAAELLAAALTPLTGGVEIRDAETFFATAPERAAVVALCAPSDLDSVLAVVEETLATARAAGATFEPVTMRQRSAHEDEWRDVWKQFFRATRIGRRFVVRPSWDHGHVDEGVDHIIDLDPGRAFGTGAHPSTELVIATVERLAEQHLHVGRFLDLGCGSGILSIAASLLWPRAEGVAVDVDQEATACTGENLARNRIGTVSVATGSIEAASGVFDLVMANIQADVLQELAPALRARLAAQGRLVLSGLLTTAVEPVVQTFCATGLALLDRPEQGEWASLLFRCAET
jgi:ribosomal protein L11 methyltransferase